MDENALYLRYLLIGVGILIFIFSFIVIAMAWKRLSISEKLYGCGTLFYSAYVGDALREAIKIEYPFRIRLVLLLLGQVCFVLWILEPSRARASRFGLSWPGRKPPS